MATLKSIKNKYLVPADGTVLGVTTNTENVSLFSFKLATADSLSKFNLVDVFSDDYQDATGVDTGGATNETLTSGYYYGNESNMTLLSNAYTAQAAPTTARIIMDEYTSTGSATVNTDIKAYASRDSGTNYTQITLADQGTIETNHRLLSGSVDISGQPYGTAIKYKIETLNQSGSKITRLYGTSMAWA